MNFAQCNSFFILVLLTTVLFFLPAITHAQVLFSEIAWMGTDVSANDEWIELYNLSSTPTDVTGWTITLNDGPFITLAGTLAPHGIAVLERTDDDVVPGTAFQIYIGALVNVGASLSLKDLSGNVSDEAIGGMNWEGIGGSNVTGHPKMTPQRTRTGTWVTGAPTPGADNVQTSEVIPAGETNDDENNETETKTVTSKSSGGGGSSRPAEKKKEPGILQIIVRAPKIVYVNQRVDLEVVPSGVGSTIASSLSYLWNFGDTNTGTGRKTSHTFAYPGEYVVIARAEFAKQSAMVRHEVKVLSVALTLESTKDSDVLVKNNSSEEVDLGGFTIGGTNSFTFPSFTILKSKGSLTVPKEKLGMGLRLTSLYDTEKTPVARLASSEIPVDHTPIVRTAYTAQSYTIPVPVVVAKTSPETFLETQPMNILATADTKNVITIGNVVAPKSEGFFRRFMEKITGFFGN